MYTFLTRHLLLLILTCSVFTFYVGHLNHWNLELVVLGTTSLTLAIAILLERRIPFDPNWNKSQGDTTTDLTSAFVLIALVDPFLKFLSPIVVVAVYSLLNLARPNSIIDPASLPLIIHIIVVTLLVELGRYWSHRLHHVLAPLWRLHAMHHSSRRLYAINNLRFHPLNYGLNFGVSVLPVMILGFPPEALLGYLAISQPILMLQHANLNLNSGWLNYVFSTNELHRWHHSNSAEEANSNYGNAIVLWDHVFNTFRYEADSINSPRTVGLFASHQNYPEKMGYFKQLCSSFKPGCCAT